MTREQIIDEAVRQWWREIEPRRAKEMSLAESFDTNPLTRKETQEIGVVFWRLWAGYAMASVMSL